MPAIEINAVVEDDAQNIKLNNKIARLFQYF